ncbi:MAG: transposase [Nitrospira sp.]|nr:transposase [Nitrospira sp.]
MAKRSPFTKECKLEALRLWKSSGRPAAAVARELGLRRNHLYQWQHELETFGEASFPGKGGRAARADELTRLRREKARLREERDMFKIAAAFFARESP